MSKPTMQDIADALSVSRITVWKALSNRPGVSDSMRAQIHQKATEMGYFHSLSGYHCDRLCSTASPHTHRSGSRVPTESSLFWMQIIHQIAKDLSEHNVNLMYTYLPTNYKAGYVLPEPLTNGTVDGVIVLNTYSAPLLRLLSSLPIPKVFLDTVPSVPYNQLHGDLLIIEGRDLIRQITNSLLLHGCRKLSFIGDVEYAQTNKDRYEGFLDALHEHGIIPNPSLYLTGSLGLRTHYEEISRFLDFLPTMPDGIVCASDYIAHFIQRYLEEKG
ncbi:LacI family DNA-binding transcriptional regulator [Gemmiger formicilis]|nr:LacI family DNA-binding transcriptional regulator [Gemmiger formicilis]